MKLIGTVIWFVVVWAFILTILFQRWHAREHRDAEATEEALGHTRQNTSHDHEQDALL